MLRWMGLICALLTAAAKAQTYYEPLQYEFCAGGTLYFYGGDQPLVHRAAAELQSPGVAWGRQAGFAFSSATIDTSREVETEHVRVFSDSFRYGLQDAGLVGFTVADAHNEAYASVPRYFHKSQLLNDSPPVNGVRIVPVRSGGVTIRKSSGPVIVPSARPLIILPKPSIPLARTQVARSSVD